MGIDSTARDDDPPATVAGEESYRRADGPRPEDRTHQRAETRTREQYADAMRADGSALSRENSRDNRERFSLGENPEGDQPSERDFDADQAASSTQARHQLETITFDNKDVEVTHNAADGIWIEGLPGEPPARIGDLVTSPENPVQGRGEKLRAEFNKEAEDISDTAGKWADHLQEILDHPRPTHSMTHSRSPETPMAGSEHGINAGHGAEAVVTLAIVGAAVVHKLHERWERAWEH